MHHHIYILEVLMCFLLPVMSISSTGSQTLMYLSIVLFAQNKCMGLSASIHVWMVYLCVVGTFLTSNCNLFRP